MRLVPAAPDLPADPPELIFQWERRTHAHWRLVGIVALSLLAHAVSFYALQIAYTPTGSQLPPPAQVVMIGAGEPGDDAFARWLAMADPALVVQPAPPTDAETLAMLDFRYVPSYAASHPRFKSLDPLPGEGVITTPPRPRLPGPVPVALASVKGRRAGSPAAGRQTRVVLTGGIEKMLGGPLPPLQFKTARGSEPLEPTVFLVGVRPEGGAPFLFRDSAMTPVSGKTRSGEDATGESARVYPASAAADEFARSYLAGLDFRPSAEPAGGVRWGRAEFAWGSDIYQ